MKKSTKILLLLSVFVATLLACQSLSNLSFLPNSISNAPQGTPLAQTSLSLPASSGLASTPPAPDLVALQDTLVNLYQKVNPGVVSIRVLTESGDGLGSGFVYDEQGHIITNYHVIEGQTDLEIDFPSGYKTRGKVIGTDTDSDLAVLKVDAPKEEIHPLPLGDSSKVQVGQTVVAIGNPFGLSGTMTLGIISAKGRTLESLREAPGGGRFSAGDILQTDAAINPGNSGGPLLNLNGEVIGINRAIRTLNFTLTEEPVNSGVGFAIAINIAKRVVPALITEGKYDYPYLGITSMNDMGLIEQEALGLPRSTGAYVISVTPNSPADKAGLIGGSRPTNISGLNAGGDLIIAIDGQPVRDFGELLSYLINYKSPGDVVKLTVLRGEKELTLDLTLGKRP
jgi:S1-C subfamily serine protease